MSHDNGQLPTVETVLDQFSSVTVPLDIEQRLDARLSEFLREPETLAVPLRSSISPPSRRRFIQVSMAAGFAVLAFGALFVAFASHDAWAQVEKTVRSKPWVRFTFHTPKGIAVPDTAPPPESRESWISTEHKVAAHREGQAAGFIDIARNVAYDYDARTKSLNLWQTREQDVDIGFLDTLLRLVAGEDAELKLSRTPLKIIERTRSEVQDGDHRWIEFKFDCRKPPQEFLLIVRVDPETQLPVQLRISGRMSPDVPMAEQTVLIDYPETGPSDIYALGVPRNAPIVDQRRSRKTENGEEIKAFLDAYIQAKAKPIEPFSMTVLTSRPGTDFTEISDAFRGRDDGQGVQLEQVNPREQVFDISKQVRVGQIKQPDGTDPAEWWKQQIAEMKFAPTQEFHHGYLPNRIGYPEALTLWMTGPGPSPIDNPDVEITLDRHPRLGPPGTVLLSIRVETTVGNALFFWIDPEKDYLVLRQEVHFKKVPVAWDNQTVIIDTVAQSPKGRWNATKARYGRIEKHGDDLPTKAIPADFDKDPMEIGPTTTMAYRYLVEFK